MTKCNESFKLAIVQEYLSSSLGYKALGDKHAVDRAVIRRRACGYEQHGLAGLRKKSSHYSAQFKRSVLERMRAESLSCRQVIALFDLRVSTAVVAAWEHRPPTSVRWKICAKKTNTCAWRWRI